ncbi:MAG TPA: metallophosphoesterase [Polyangiaceae bacterium]|nr:metallophosphoesterase [Polyangiaceae bacterium]
MQRPLLQFVLFIAVFSLIIGAGHYYLWSRLVRAPELSPTWHRVGTWALGAAAVMVPVGLFLIPELPRRAGTILGMIVYGWVGVAMLLVFLLFASEVVRVAVHLASSAASSGPADEGRRTFLSRGIAAVVGVLALGIAGVGAASALGEVAVRSVRVSLRRLSSGMSGFRVVQLTDVHIGPTLGREWLASIVDRVNALEPDLIVITGDLVDGSVEALRDHVAPLANLRSKHGTYFVTGNHEYYSGVDAWMAELKRLGVRVLRNERVTIGEGDDAFDLAGVDDWASKGFGGGHGPNLARALEGRDPKREVILLAHQPKQIREAAALGVGLQISGHTHGGQIFPWTLFVRLDQPYIAGLSQHEGTQIYVSRGTGYWGPPMRVAAPAEITVLELTSGAAANASETV